MDVPLSIWSMVAIKWQLNADRPDKEQAGLVSHWAVRTNLTLFFEPVLAYCKCLKDTRYAWWGRCRDFLSRASGPMVQRDDERTGSAVGEVFITVHMCRSFIRPTVRLRRSTHLVVQLHSFLQRISLTLSWRSNLLISKLFSVFLSLSVICSSPWPWLVLISGQFMTSSSLMFASVSLINVLPFLSFFRPPSCSLTPSLLPLSPASVCAVWMSSYIISMPLALIIDSSCRSPPSSPFADTEFWGDPWTLSPSAFRFPPQNSHWISTFLPSRPFLIILFLPFNK